MMMDTAIIADDLTGACDTGIKLRKLGFDTQVIINTDSCEYIRMNGSHIFSINTDTRSCMPDEAYTAVRKSVRKLMDNGIECFYKKIDSILRGNIGRELDAMLDEAKYDLAVIAPALPDNGRIIRGGELIELSAFETDGETRIAAKDAICATTSRAFGIISLDIVKRGASALAAEIERLYNSGNKLVLIDSEDNDNLLTIAMAIGELKLKILPVGSAGLIAYMWPICDDIGTSSDNNDVMEGDGTRLLIAAGSVHPATIAQLQQMKYRDDISIYTFSSDGITYENTEEKICEIKERIIKDFESNKEDFAIVITTDSILSAGFSGYKPVPGVNISNAVIADAIGEIASSVIKALNINRLIATGGDIAGCVFNKAGIKQIKLMDEPMPGIAAGEAFTVDGRKLYISTKSGAFGDRWSLERLVDYMKCINNKNAGW